jgi:hypothetical protein
MIVSAIDSDTAPSSGYRVTIYAMTARYANC